MILRSLWRHKIRSTLTIVGIAIAIAAIVSLGSISEGINSMVQEQMKLASNFIVVTERGVSGAGADPESSMASKVDTDIIDGIMQIEGVDRVSRRSMTLDPANNLFIVGIDLDLLDMFSLENINFAEGSWPEEGEYEMVLGYSSSEATGLKVGDEIKLNKDRYVVSGVLEEMRNFMDYAAIVPYVKYAETYDTEGYASTLIVSPVDVRESDRIADEIEDNFDTVEAITPAETLQKAEDTVNRLRVMTLAIGIVASLVASIGIVNTMMMVVSEQKREFGIMKALGAERQMIIFLVIQEGMVLAVIGGSLGLLIGAAGTEGLNQLMGMSLAAVTPTLAVLSFVYGIVIAVIASAYPAYQAVNVDPAEAMRME